ncbi:MAG: response regulator [Eubacteriaceae bacterium]|nr:response regulator [Eubacteriaceae bacterium]
MKTILVDDEPLMLDMFDIECSGIDGIEMQAMFTRSEEALEYAMHSTVELALLDVQMPGMNGIELASELRKISPEMVIVFITAFPEYTPDILDVRGDYIVLKPYSRERVEDMARRAKLLSARMKKRVSIRTFGRFGVFLDGNALVIHSKNSLELLALLVDRRGGAVSAESAFPVLFEGDVYSENSSSKYRKALINLEKDLQENGASDIIRRDGRFVNLCTDRVDCDLFRFMDGDPEAVMQFNGEYMSQYSWGEYTLGYLVRRKAELENDPATGEHR